MTAKKPMDFGQTARQLARNPLGIIALFIALIYGIAGLVFGISGAYLDAIQKWPLILFLVLFPPMVFVGFIWLVAKHSSKLYAPSDFRDDESFVQLNRKVSVIEVRQQASEIDPRTGSETAMVVLQSLLNAEQVDAAKSLAKAFLKVERFEVSLEMFRRIIDSLDEDERISVVQYRAYSLIGLGRYLEALKDLDRLRSSGRDDVYDFWPRLGLAYCHFKLKHNDEFEVAFRSAVAYEGASDYRNVVPRHYPELADTFCRRLESPAQRTESREP